MICNKCNFQNEDAAKFCRNCGAKLTTKPKKKQNIALWCICLFMIAIIVIAGIFAWQHYNEVAEKKKIEAEKERIEAEKKEAVENHYKRGQEAFDEKLYDLALSHYTKVLEIDSTFAEGYVGMAKCHRNIKPFNSETAFKYCQKALYFNPNLAEAYLTLAYISYDDAHRFMTEYRLFGEKNNLFAQAIKYTQKAIELDPNNGEAYYRMGWCYRLQKEDEQANKCYRRAAELEHEKAKKMIKGLEKN